LVFENPMIILARLQIKLSSGKNFLKKISDAKFVAYNYIAGENLIDFQNFEKK